MDKRSVVRRHRSISTHLLYCRCSNIPCSLPQRYNGEAQAIRRYLRPPPSHSGVRNYYQPTRHQERYITPNERKLTSAKTMSYLCIGNGKERLSPNPSAREGIGYNRNARARFNRTSRARWTRASKTCSLREQADTACRVPTTTIH